MIGFCRTVTVSAEFPDEEGIRMRGSLADHIYAMELEVDIRIADGVITAIDGTMKRVTTPWCGDAVPVLQKAVGMSVREEGWISKINRDIGRQGCEHFAAILVECGRCLDTARLCRGVVGRLAGDPSRPVMNVAAAWIDEHPEAWILSATESS
jgi:hypothetical protein